MTAHQCYAYGCARLTREPFCAPHWADIPSGLRDQVRRTWRAGLGADSTEYFVAVADAALALRDNAHRPPRKAPASVRCRCDEPIRICRCGGQTCPGWRHTGRNDGHWCDNRNAARPAPSAHYLYSIECCGREIDIFDDQPSECAGCGSTFVTYQSSRPSTPTNSGARSTLRVGRLTAPARSSNPT